ncbi:MAG TPA: hypothetical protein VH596_12115 [Terriglobales bacterium]
MKCVLIVVSVFAAFSASAASSARISRKAAAVASGVTQANAVRRLGWPLDLTRIERTLVEAAIVDSPDLARARIVPPPEFTTLAPNPRFDVLRARMQADRGIFVEMRCHERRVCGRFAVEIHCASNKEGKCARARQKPSRSTIGVRARPALVKAGKPALLVIEEGGVKITEIVIPGKRGLLGDVVPVRNPTNHVFLPAQVVGQGLLRWLSTAQRKADE